MMGVFEIGQQQVGLSCSESLLQLRLISEGVGGTLGNDTWATCGVRYTSWRGPEAQSQVDLDGQVGK